MEADVYTSNRNNNETINLLELIKIAYQRFEQISFKFDCYFDENSFNESGNELEPLINFNKEDFLVLFSNVVTNAIDHGFKNTKGNIIRSIIKYDSINENCILEVSNNGIPMPENFTFEHLTTRGEKTTDSKGTGIGGADIKDIITAHKGTFELIKDPNASFPVTYKFIFPINKNNI